MDTESSDQNKVCEDPLEFISCGSFKAKNPIVAEDDNNKKENFFH